MEKYFPETKSIARALVRAICFLRAKYFSVLTNTSVNIYLVPCSSRRDLQIHACWLVGWCVRAFVGDAVFSELARYFFLIFCMKLGDHKCSKVTKPDFSGKISFPSFGEKRGQKQGFLNIKEIWLDTFCYKWCQMKVHNIL